MWVLTRMNLQQAQLAAEVGHGLSPASPSFLAISVHDMSQMRERAKVIDENEQLETLGIQQEEINARRQEIGNVVNSMGRIGMAFSGYASPFYNRSMPLQLTGGNEDIYSPFMSGDVVL